jgi:predicted ATPase/class 3 adenylate cyclase
VPQEDRISAPCPRCGRTAAAGDRFCGGCGTELITACPRCGRQLVTDTQFCTGCGLPRESGRAAQNQEERRQVSLLFIDLVDFTPYVERADPELVRGMQTGFFAAARRVIGQYGGVVEKYIGDAVMALFGAPVATETDPLRCVRAGLELQRVLARFAPTGSEGMRFRAGVATGEAIVDLAAARDGGQAIVAGDVVNTASRIQAIAPPGGVLVCASTYALTRAAIRYSEHPAVTLRGRSTPTEVWLAVAAVQRRHAEPEDSTPLVGREHELGLLVNALHRALSERTPQLVTVFGRAGIGKSRLVRELYRHSERLIDQAVTWRTGHCPPFGEDGAFAPLADIVKAEAGILDTDTAAAAAARLAETVRDLVGFGRDAKVGGGATADADRMVDALRPLVGLTGPRLPAEEAESAWRRFLIALATRRPTVLVFEDVHCADESMRRFIEVLSASARDVPLLVLCTARPELVEQDPSWAGTIAGSLTITLPPLRSNGIAALFAHLFGQAAFSADLLTPLVELADGNPLYAQEYVRMLIERGAVRQGGRGWVLESTAAAGAPGGPGWELPMPDSVHAVIANRIDLLDAVDRSVLLAASVVGTQFWPGAVAAALGRPVEVVERSLRRLEQREFVHEQAESTMAGQSEFRFRHVLVRDVCYRRLPRTERVARHQRTSDWLDALSQTRHTDLAEVLAHHRWAAYEIARDLGVDAARYAPAARDALRRAAQRAYALHALDAAATHAERGLALFDAEASSADDPVDRLRLELFSTEIAFYRDQAAFLSGAGAEQLKVLAERLLAGGDQGQAARAWTLLGQAAWLQADRAAALSHLDHAVRLFEGEPDSQEKAEAHAELGRLHMLGGERDGAIAAASAAAAIAERLGLVEVQANARITAGYARHQAGDPAGLDELEEALQMCRQHRLLALRRAARNLASAVLEEGDFTRSVALAAEGQDETQGGHTLATDWSDEAFKAYYSGDFDRLLDAAEAYVDTQSGRWDLQVRGLRSCLRVLRGEPVPRVQAAGAGGPGQRSDDIADAIEMARGSGFHRLLWTTLGTGALCRALQGRQAEAVELLTELAESWRKVPALFSGEWSAATATAAVLCGRPATTIVREMLRQATHLTRWGQAAQHTVNAALADADGDHGRAAELYTGAAEVYAQIPNTTERMICLALAAGALTRADQTAPAELLLAEVRAFALRNRAPGLLRLTHPGGQDVSWSPDLAS